MPDIHERQNLLLGNNDEFFKEKDLKGFGQVFKERFIQQLDYDLNVNERQEIKIRKELGDIILRKSNNDKKIIGTINHYVENLKYDNYQGGVENWNEVSVTGIMNDYLVGTKLTVDGKMNRDFFKPVELMKELVE